MTKHVSTLFYLALALALLSASPVFAADVPGTGAFYGTALGAGLGAAITLVGAGYGFGKIGSAALESMARQPETAGQVQTAMLIVAALLEGATFFGLIGGVKTMGFLGLFIGPVLMALLVAIWREWVREVELTDNAAQALSQTEPGELPARPIIDTEPPLKERRTG